MISILEKMMINILEINHHLIFKIIRLTIDLDILKADYNKGLNTGIKAMDRWDYVNKKNASEIVKNY